MRIPKYISHPSLLILGGLAIASLLWVAVPSSTEVKENLQTKPLNELKNQDFIAISDFESGGILRFENGQSLPFQDTAFKNLNEAQIMNFKSLFVSRFMAKKDLEVKNLSLPLSLWDASCFVKSSAPERKEICPFVLTP